MKLLEAFLIRHCSPTLAALENGKPFQLLLFNGKRADRGYRVLERDVQSSAA